jgi:hypothetical protein
MLVCSGRLIGAGPGLGALVVEVALRPVNDSDLDALFEQRRDPESVRMAAFVTEDPDDRTAFDVHMSKVRTSPEVTIRAVIADGRLVGSVGSFVVEGDTEVTYWIDRSFWGQGIAGRRWPCSWNRCPSGPCSPVPRVTMWDRSGVLQRAGFAIIGTEISFANGRNAEIEETILRLDEPAKTAPSEVSGGETQTS